MISVWYDSAHPGLYFGGSAQVWPPASLLAVLNPDTTIEIWTASNTSRLAGPVAYTMLADASGNGFASAALAKAYLDGAFAMTPIPTGTILPVRVVLPGAAADVQVTLQDTMVLIACADVQRVHLPSGASVGQQFFVKDAIGRAGQSPFTVLPPAGELVDGQASVLLSNAYESLTLIHTSNLWSLI